MMCLSCEGTKHSKTAAGRRRFHSFSFTLKAMAWEHPLLVCWLKAYFYYSGKSFGHMNNYLVSVLGD